MPIKNAAKKALRQSTKKRERNKLLKEKMRALIKKFKKTIAAKKTEEAKSLTPIIAKTIDKSAKNNIIKKNTASRIKSRLNKALNKILAEAK